MHFRNLEYYNVENDNALSLGTNLYHAPVEVNVAI